MANKINDNFYAHHTILIDQSQRSMSRSQWPHNSMLQPTTLKCIKPRNLWRYASTESRDHGHSDPKNGTQHFAPKIHPHTEFGIPALNSVGGMLRTRCEDSYT